MARQVLNAVFPLLKAEWALSDGQLGLLSGVVAIMVGLLTFPLSLLADRLGRVKQPDRHGGAVEPRDAALRASPTIIEQMLAGRLLVGVGEAAYGSVGIAVVVSVFPEAPSRRPCRRPSWPAACLARCSASASAARSRPRMAGGWPSWRSRLAAWPSPSSIRCWSANGGSRRCRPTAGNEPYERKQAVPEARQPVCRPHASNAPMSAAGCSCSSPARCRPGCRPISTAITTCRSTSAALARRAVPARSAASAWSSAGIVSDRLFSRPDQRVRLAIGYCLACAAAARRRARASARPAAAGPARPRRCSSPPARPGRPARWSPGLTPAAIHGTAFATLTLANNFLGLAPGPIVTGWLADRIGLLGALAAGCRWPASRRHWCSLCARQSSRADLAFAE